LPLEPRMYIIVREDLAYKFIQGQHALAKFSIEHHEKFLVWNNQYLINLSVFNGLALQELRINLLESVVEFSSFFEPDLESPLPTALCLFDNGVNGYREHLKHLNLASK